MRPGPAGEGLVRAVVDVNVLISSVLSAQGPSAEVLRASRDGRFELIGSALLFAELERALAYPKLRKRIPAEPAAAFVGWLRAHATIAEDPDGVPLVRSPDPDDDYLLALAADQRAFLVTGDQHLLGVAEGLPILTPGEFVAELDRWG
jgi:putative PIN family toxin of toxin-antitoxin system